MPKPTETLPKDHEIDRSVIKYPKFPDLIIRGPYHCWEHGTNDTHDTRGCRTYARKVGFLPDPDDQLPKDEPEPGPSKPNAMTALKFAREHTSKLLADMGQATRKARQLVKMDQEEKEEQAKKIEHGRVTKSKKAEHGRVTKGKND